MYRFIMVFLLLVEPAVADTIYKCVEGGKTTYSSSPCSGKPAKELYYSQPTPQERAQSQAASATLSAELQRREEWMRIQRQAGSMNAQPAAPSINAQPQFDPFDEREGHGAHAKRVGLQDAGADHRRRASQGGACGRPPAVSRYSTGDDPRSVREHVAESGWHSTQPGHWPALRPSRRTAGQLPLTPPTARHYKT